MSAPSDVKTQAACSLVIKDKFVLWNGREIYNIERGVLPKLTDFAVDYYPFYFDPIYSSLSIDNDGKTLDPSKLDTQDYSVAVAYTSDKKIVQAQWQPTIGTDTHVDSQFSISLQTDDPINQYTISEEGIGGSSWNRRTGAPSYASSIPLLDYKGAPDVKIEKERKVVVFATSSSSDPLLFRYLNHFLGTIEGFYIAPYAYQALRGFSIITKPLYGFVLLRTYPDSRFYLQFERNPQGALVGEFIRTRLIPFMTKAEEGEIEGCFDDRGLLVPVCYSYYDPAGSGKRITREEYMEYLAKRKQLISEQSSLPAVLLDLLGF